MAKAPISAGEGLGLAAGTEATDVAGATAKVGEIGGPVLATVYISAPRIRHDRCAVLLGKLGPGLVLFGLSTVGFVLFVPSASATCTVSVNGDCSGGDCLVNVGSIPGTGNCNGGGSCLVNTGTCATNGDCDINAGTCENGGTCLVNFFSFCNGGSCILNLVLANCSGSCPVNVASNCPAMRQSGTSQPDRA